MIKDIDSIVSILKDSDKKGIQLKENPEDKKELSVNKTERGIEIHYKDDEVEITVPYNEGKGYKSVLAPIITEHKRVSDTSTSMKVFEEAIDKLDKIKNYAKKAYGYREFIEYLSFEQEGLLAKLFAYKVGNTLDTYIKFKSSLGEVKLKSPKQGDFKYIAPLITTGENCPEVDWGLELEQYVKNISTRNIDVVLGKTRIRRIEEVFYDYIIESSPLDGKFYDPYLPNSDVDFEIKCPERSLLSLSPLIKAIQEGFKNNKDISPDVLEFMDNIENSLADIEKQVDPNHYKHIWGDINGVRVSSELIPYNLILDKGEVNLKVRYYKPKEVLPFVDIMRKLGEIQKGKEVGKEMEKVTMAVNAKTLNKAVVVALGYRVNEGELLTAGELFNKHRDLFEQSDKYRYQNREVTGGDGTVTKVAELFVEGIPASLSLPSCQLQDLANPNEQRHLLNSINSVEGLEIPREFVLEKMKELNPIKTASLETLDPKKRLMAIYDQLIGGYSIKQYMDKAEVSKSNDYFTQGYKAIVNLLTMPGYADSYEGEEFRKSYKEVYEEVCMTVGNQVFAVMMFNEACQELGYETQNTVWDYDTVVGGIFNYIRQHRHLSEELKKKASNRIEVSFLTSKAMFSRDALYGVEGYIVEKTTTNPTEENKAILENLVNNNYFYIDFKDSDWKKRVLDLFEVRVREYKENKNTIQYLLQMIEDLDGY